jgi:hypothetical protein
MLRVALGLLALGAFGFLSILSNIAVVGPCTDTFGAVALLSVVVATPAGFILLVVALIVRTRRKTVSPFGASDKTLANPER